MHRVLDALHRIEPGRWLEVLTPLRPTPLLPILESFGYAWQLDGADDGPTTLRICRREDAGTLFAPATPT